MKEEIKQLTKEVDKATLAQVDLEQLQQMKKKEFDKNKGELDLICYGDIG